jgi:hypothetical protein
LSKLFKAELGFMKSANLAGEMVTRRWGESRGDNYDQRALSVLVASASALCDPTLNQSELVTYLWCHQKVHKNLGLFSSVATAMGDRSAAAHWFMQKAKNLAEETRQTEFFKTLPIFPSWLSPKSVEAQQAEKILQQTKHEVDELRRSIGDLALAIVSAGWKCSQSVKPPAQHPQLQEIYVFYEFLYFFLHLLNRQAHRKLSPNIRAKVQDELAAIIVPTAIDTFCAHWPEKLKSGIRQEFFQNLNDAEREYASCKRLFPEKTPIEDTALCSRLAMNISKHAGYHANVERSSDTGLKFIGLVFGLVRDSLAGPLKNLGEMVEKAGAVIEASV